MSTTRTHSDIAEGLRTTLQNVEKWSYHEKLGWLVDLGWANPSSASQCMRVLEEPLTRERQQLASIVADAATLRVPHEGLKTLLSLLTVAESDAEAGRLTQTSRDKILQYTTNARRVFEELLANLGICPLLPPLQ